jgi:glycosyltransferase involved in cell wall biosynthesis
VWRRDNRDVNAADSERMKITFLIRSLTFGGAERQLVVLAKELHARGHQVRVGVFYADGPLERDLTEAGIAVTVLNKQGRWDTFGFLARLAVFLRSTQPDVVHGYLGTSNYLSLLLKPFHRGKVVWGVRASEMDGGRYDWFYRLDSNLERWLSRFPDLIIANSRTGRAHVVEKGYPAERTIVIPNGIDTRRFAPDREARIRMRAELGVSDDQILIGRVGRLDPQKDYPGFLRAAAIVAARNPTVRFLLVGGGPESYAAELKSLAGELGLAERTLWLEPRADMPAIYNALDLLVSSSVYGEGVPNVVAEAMATGVPAVVTDCGDSAWVVGQTGAVVPVSDAEALAAAIIDQLGREADRGALRTWVMSLMSVESLVERTEAALHQIAGNRSVAWA